MIIKYGEWAPDLSEYHVGGGECRLTVAANVVALSDGYEPINVSGTSGAGALGARCQGAFSSIYGGATQDFLGDDTDLWTVTDYQGTPTAVSSATAAYTTNAGDYWDFTQYGRQVLAVNGGTSTAAQIQGWALGSSTAFADISGSPPAAATISVVRQQVVCGNTYDATDGAVPYRIRWSGIGNHEAWSVSAATQADFQDLNSYGGKVQRVLGGATGKILQETAVTVMSPADAGLAFRFDEGRGIGTPAPRSAVQHAGSVYFLGWDGFYRWNPGSGEIIPIGRNKVDNTVLSALTTASLVDVIGCVDYVHQAIVWLYGVDLSSGSGANNCVMYSIKADRWTSFATTTTFVGSPTHVEYMYTSYINGSGTPYFVDTDHQVVGLEGTDFASTLIEVVPIELTPQRRTLVKGVRPLYRLNASGSATTNALNIDSSENVLDSVRTLTTGSYNSFTGAFQFRNSGRYHYFRQAVKPGVSGKAKLFGLDIFDYSPLGRQ